MKAHIKWSGVFQEAFETVWWCGQQSEAESRTQPGASIADVWGLLNWRDVENCGRAVGARCAATEFGERRRKLLRHSRLPCGASNLLGLKFWDM